MSPQEDLFPHQDILAKLHESLPLSDKLRFLHQIIREDFPFIDRLSIALFDEKTNMLKTYTHSTEGVSPLVAYEVPLGNASSLREVMHRRRPRVVQDLSIFAQGIQEHTKRVATTGYQASYTMPLYQSDTFIGFLFFNSFKPNAFVPESLRQIDIYGHLIALMVINELTAIRTLLAAVQAARNMTHYRDIETGSHIAGPLTMLDSSLVNWPQAIISMTNRLSISSYSRRFTISARSVFQTVSFESRVGLMRKSSR